MRYLRWVAGLAISMAALFLAFRGVEWSGVGDSLGEANYALLAAAVPLLILLTVFRAQRWRLLFRPDASVSLMAAFGSLNIGYMANNVLPFQLGELARAYVLGEWQQVSKVRALSTIAVERIVDTLTLLVLLGLLLPFVDLPRIAAVTAGIVLVAALAAGGCVVLAVVDRPRVERWYARIAGQVPTRFKAAADRGARSLLDGVSGLRATTVLLPVLGWTVVSWATSSAVLYLILEAFSVDVPITAAPFLLVATTFGFFVPSSPANLGVYDAISIRTLTEVFSVDHEIATSYALVAHALYLVPPTLLGFAFFLWRHISFRAIESWREPAPPVEAPAVALSGHDQPLS